MAPSPTPLSARSSLPRLYTFLLTTLEPLFATCGVLTLLLSPSTYTTQTSRSLLTSATLPASTSFLFTELAGSWAYLAFVEAVVLRLVDDLRVWRLLAMGMLVSDVFYVWSLAQAVGGWAVWVRLGEWEGAEWVAMVGTVPFVVVRVCIVLGVGVREGRGGGMRKKTGKGL